MSGNRSRVAKWLQKKTCAKSPFKVFICYAWHHKVGQKLDIPLDREKRTGTAHRFDEAAVKLSLFSSKTRIITVDCDANAKATFQCNLKCYEIAIDSNVMKSPSSARDGVTQQIRQIFKYPLQVLKYFEENIARRPPLQRAWLHMARRLTHFLIYRNFSVQGLNWLVTEHGDRCDAGGLVFKSGLFAKHQPQARASRDRHAWPWKKSLFFVQSDFSQKKGFQ